MRSNDLSLTVSGVLLYVGNSRYKMAQTRTNAEKVLKAANFTGEVMFTERYGNTVEMRSTQYYRYGRLLDSMRAPETTNA